MRKAYQLQLFWLCFVIVACQQATSTKKPGTPSPPISDVPVIPSDSSAPIVPNDSGTTPGFTLTGECSNFTFAAGSTSGTVQVTYTQAGLNVSCVGLIVTSGGQTKANTKTTAGVTAGKWPFEETLGPGAMAFTFAYNVRDPSNSSCLSGTELGTKVNQTPCIRTPN